MRCKAIAANAWQLYLHMAQRYPICCNYLLMHGRERCGLTVLQVCRRTGIDAKKYALMETGRYIIGQHEAELLGTLLAIPPPYLMQGSICLEWMHSHRDVVRIKNEKIRELTKALKQKIHSRH